MKTLHYGALPLSSEIKELDFENLKDLTAFVYNEVSDIQRKSVFIITFNMGDDCSHCPVFVTEDAYEFIALIASNDGFYNEFVDTFFLQEYESYKDAYKVALDMREPNPLCYNKKELVG